MEQWQRKHIERNLQTLINDTNCSETFLSYLIQYGKLSDEDIDQITHQQGMIKTNSKLYDLIKTRTEAYEVLLKALFETKQTGLLENLLDHYIEKKNVINPIKLLGFNIASNPASLNTDRLRSIAKKEALNTTISYQGIPSTIDDLLQGMNDISRNQILSSLDLNSITEIIGKGLNYVLVKDPVPENSGVHQPRVLRHLRYKVDTRVFSEDKKNLFVFKNIEHYNLSFLVRPLNTQLSSDFVENPKARLVLLNSIDDFKSIQKINSCNVFLLNYENNNFYLEATKGSFDTIKCYLKHEPIDISEDELVKSLIDFRTLVCISTLPGMGNTKLLESIARHLTETGKAFVSLIDFEVLLKRFKNYKAGATDHILRDVLLEYSQTEFGRAFLEEKFLFSKSQKYICIDNLDKIQKKDIKIAENVLRTLQRSTSKELRIVITVPFHLNSFIQQIFPKPSFAMKLWSLSEQKQFLSTFFKNNGFSLPDATLCTKKLLQLLNYQLPCHTHDITAFPSHCRALAEKTIGVCKHSYFMKRNYKDIVFNCVREIVQKRFDLILAERQAIYFAVEKVIFCKCNDPNISDQVGWLAFNILDSFDLKTNTFTFFDKAHITNILIQSSILFEYTNLHIIQKTILEYLAAEYLFKGLILRSRKSQVNDALKSIFKFLTSFDNTEDKLLRDMPQEEKVKVKRFSNSGIIYFLNNFMVKTPLKPEQVEYFLTCCGGIDMNQKRLFDILSACVYHDFRQIFDLCVSLYCHRIELSEINTSLHEFNAIRLAAKYASTESFMHYWETLENIGFNAKYNHRVDGALTPIHISVHYGNYSLFEALREVYGMDTIESMHLLHACIIGSVSRRSQDIIDQRVQMVKLLVKENVGLLKNDIVGDKNRTALLQPHTHISLLECLVELGADVNDLTYSDNSVLHQALLTDKFSKILSLSDFKKLCVLVKGKGFIHFDNPNSLGDTPLHLLVQKMEIDEEIITMFKDANVDLSKKNRRGENILFIALRYRRSLDTLKDLLSFNIDCTDTDNFNQTLLHFSIISENLDVIRFILSLQKIDVNTADKNGDTAMHLAARIESEEANEIQKLLLEVKTNLALKNKKGNIPIVDGLMFGSRLNFSVNTIKYMEYSNFLITDKLANECLEAIIINPNLSYSSIRSKEFSEVFDFMVGKAKTNMNISRSYSNAWPKTDSTLENYEICNSFLKQNSISSLISFRKKEQAIHDKKSLYIRIPHGLDTVLDNPNQTLLYFTPNTYILRQRLCECLGKNILVYPNCQRFPSIFSTGKFSVDILLVDVGVNSKIFQIHNKFISISRKIIYIATIGTPYNENFGFPGILDTLRWSDLTKSHQKILQSKVNKFLDGEILEFRDEDYKSLSTEQMCSFILKRNMPLDVFCELVKKKYNDIWQQFSTQEINVNLVQESLHTIFPDEFNDVKESPQACTPTPNNPNQEMVMSFYDDENIINIDYKTSEGLTDNSLSKVESFMYLGLAIAKNVFKDKNEKIDSLFSIKTSYVYILKLDSLTTEDGSKARIICFEFSYPVLTYFYNKSFKNPYAFLQVVGRQVRPYISACIRANLGALLNDINKKKDGWFLDEELVFIAIRKAHLSTIQIVVKCFENVSKKKISSLSLKSNTNITPLHAALWRGDYDVVDYVLNTLRFKSKLKTMDPSALIRYSISYTASFRLDKIESRKTILELLLSHFYNEMQSNNRTLPSILKNVLVEATNIHIDLIKFLVECGASLWDTDVNMSNIAHLTPKYYNSIEYLELVKFIISQGDGQLFKSRNLGGESAIRSALNNLKPDVQHENQLCEILDRFHKDAGIKLNLPNKLQKSILQCAIDANHTPKVIQKIEQINNS